MRVSGCGDEILVERGMVEKREGGRTYLIFMVDDVLGRRWVLAQKEIGGRV